MNNLSKRDFDKYIGKDSFYTEEDKERFFNQSGKTKRRKHLIPQLLTVAFILGIFIVGANFIQNTVFLSSNDNVGPETRIELTEVDSLEKIKEYYYQLTPGLGRAEDLGLVTEVDKTLAIKEGYDLHIDKIWYNSENIHVYYSIGIPEIKTVYQNSIPAISNLKILGDEDGRFLSQESGPSGINESIPIFNKRIYNHISLSPLENHNFESIDQIEEFVSIQVTTELAYKDYYDLEEIEIPLKYNEDKIKETVITTPINETFIFPGGRIVVDQFEMGVSKNYIHGDIYLDEGIHLMYGDGTIDIGTEDPLYLYFYKEDPDSTAIVMETDAFNHVPEEVNVKINSLSLYGQDAFKFSIDLADYGYFKNYENQDIKVHEKITEIKDTSIFLDKLYVDEDGLRFFILFEPKNKNQSIQLIPGSINTYQGNIGQDIPNLITVVNELGEPSDGSDIFGTRSIYEDSSYALQLIKSFVQSSERIDITVENLSYLVKVNNQSVWFELNKE
ncbi:hypothetical protein [Ornithinibacillus halotolerans]|uniref:DUF4179 domain-containing protein n=1 Tax=Ornithinibacillus halotolerans TaxID=1274357 RepID=A0A916S936_9BACI|nr:hypothetical protein [Ornithinibacillus halotolerans]GGA89703.1 hypothetical protein GCM10008025_35390 [Ornithinibacillus halotolerans]